jgi:hypothetical protein
MTVQRPLWLPLVLTAVVLLSSCEGDVLRSPGEGTTPPPSAAAVDRGPCPVQLSDLALYQTLKVPVVSAGDTVSARPVDLVEGKAALARVMVAPVDPSAPPVNVRARLTVTSSAGTSTLEDALLVGAASTEEALESSLVFSVGAELLRSDAAVAVDLLEPASCASKPEQARLPRQGMAALAPRKTGVLKVVLVPVRYDADGSGRLPDTSDQQKERIRSTMTALYPVGTVEITVRDVWTSTVDLTNSSSSGWSSFLDSMRGLRAADHAPDDVYYYGLVQPAPTLQGYCQRACIAGISFQVTENRAALRVGVGLAYPGDTTALTLAHEVGHQHGRGHAPCGATAGLDPAFPHAGGVTGTWGLDSRTSALIPPTRKDVMSYCNPQWLSDYNYQALLERSAVVNPRVAAELSPLPVGDWDVLLVDADGVTRRGHPLTGFAPPVDTAREDAEMLTGTGQSMGRVDVYRMPLADVDVSMVLVPRLPGAVKGLKLAGAATPLRLDLMARPAPLR